MRVRGLFPHRSSAQWAHLGLFSLAIVYLAFVVFELVWNAPFAYIGQDFAPLYASAGIARDHGLAAIYDLGFQKEYQSRIFLDLFGVPWPYANAPVPYLPPFVVPILPFAFLPPLVALAVWTGLNGLLLAGYLGSFARAIDTPDRNRVVACLVLSLPAFLTVPFGQSNVWLLICTGQAFLAFRSRRDVTAGFWLGGLVLKPQLLILVLPGLVLARRYRTVLAFGAATLVLLAASVLLCGVDGLMALAGLLLGFGTPSGVATNAIDHMMNWRGLAVHLQGFVPTGLAWGIALSGMVVTAGAALSLWWPRSTGSEPDWTQIWIATWAATLTVTWHSHVHMAIAILPLLLFAWIEQRHFGRIVTTWLAVPPVMFLALAFMCGPIPAHTVMGLVLLVLTLLVVFSIVRSAAPRPELSPAKELSG